MIKTDTKGGKEKIEERDQFGQEKQQWRKIKRNKMNNREILAVAKVARKK